MAMVDRESRHVLLAAARANLFLAAVLNYVELWLRDLEDLPFLKSVSDNID